MWPCDKIIALLIPNTWCSSSSCHPPLQILVVWIIHVSQNLQIFPACVVVHFWGLLTRWGVRIPICSLHSGLPPESESCLSEKLASQASNGNQLGIPTPLQLCPVSELCSVSVVSPLCSFKRKKGRVGMFKSKSVKVNFLFPKAMAIIYCEPFRAG